MWFIQKVPLTKLQAAIEVAESALVSIKTDHELAEALDALKAAIGELEKVAPGPGDNGDKDPGQDGDQNQDGDKDPDKDGDQNQGQEITKVKTITKVKQQ